MRPKRSLPTWRGDAVYVTAILVLRKVRNFVNREIANRAIEFEKFQFLYGKIIPYF